MTAWRNSDPAHPDRPDLPLPPGRMPLVRGGRPLKRWRWVGAFGPDAMACAARASIGGVPSTHTVRSDACGASCTPSTRFHATRAPDSATPTPAAQNHAVSRAW